ncbi:hypothetical protein [Solirubrum puertoriconensis]|uniref:Uncharacterized protein n=1 Tax=Solirubrum puertoriconensis TaxID=1751427 RepID=A0A9X0HK48_SOLP1|nr:hypothetical protein [Solirubrum puertoriconensis]KUG07444.1 hypothetical protein ASU33_13910 [Solirubrum puertoriconensis]
MAKRTNEQQEINLEDYFKYIKSLANQKKEDTQKIDVKGALKLFKQSQAALQESQKFLQQAIELLEAGNNSSGTDSESEEGKSAKYIENLRKFPKHPEAVLNVSWFGRSKLTGLPNRPNGTLATEENKKLFAQHYPNHPQLDNADGPVTGGGNKAARADGPVTGGGTKAKNK